MIDLVTLQIIELIPVVELEPGQFRTQDRQMPDGSSRDVPGEWDAYWSGSLVDSGITGLKPIRPGSWHVLARDLARSPSLHRFLEVITRDPEDSGAMPDHATQSALAGGFALRCGDEWLIYPTCCSDLGNITDWKKAANYRGAEWQMLWIGHPWLSIRSEDQMLVLSEPHESDSPSGFWKLDTGVLLKAVDNATAQLQDFAFYLEEALRANGVDAGSAELSRKLAGLAARTGGEDQASV